MKTYSRTRYATKLAKPTGIGPQREPGMFSASANMAGYPRAFNIEMDPHEDLSVGGLFGWAAAPGLKVVEEYLASVRNIRTRRRISRISDREHGYNEAWSTDRTVSESLGYSSRGSTN